MKPLLSLLFSVLRRALAAALWITLTVLVLKVIHDFYLHVDRAVYVAIDDGEAAIAYALAKLGRYGFLPSPTLFGMSRLHGQFNYGPWYFYLAGGLIWLFGYSLTLLRSIHLWAIVLCAAAGASWFKTRGRVAPAVFCGFGVLYFFEAVEWPMVRPDSLVALFAVAMIVSAGLAFRHRGGRWWFLAGLAAVCGAFTHLVALSLIASLGVLFIAFGLGRLRGASRYDARADIMRGAAGLVLGMAAGLVMFYASFGFDFATQWKFLMNYRSLTASTDSFMTAVLAHFRTAFWITPPWVQNSVWLSLGLGWLLLVVAVARPAHRQAAAQYLLPPLVVWTLYWVSNGKYTNYHSGYGILHHVMFVWTVAAIMWLLLAMFESRGPRLSAAGTLVFGALVLVQGVQQTDRQLTAPLREGQGAHWVPFSEYSAQVIGPIPARAEIWGTVFFGIESPDRIQLVQYADASGLMSKIDDRDRADLAPDFIIEGYPEHRDDVLTVLRGGRTSLDSIAGLLPGLTFRVVSLVNATPYGTARVYARVIPSSQPSPAPTVAYYDGIRRQWLRRTAPPLAVTFAPATPARVQIGYEADPPRVTAHATVSAELPTGPYLVKVAFKPGDGNSGRRMIAVTPATFVKQRISELGPNGSDFAPYLRGDREIYALVDHPGGVLLVSQFDDGPGAAIESVTISPLSDLIDPAERPSHAQPLPALASWTPEPGVHATAIDGGAVRVEGTSSLYGYQWSSPIVPIEPGDQIEVRVPNRILQGEVCVGAMNRTGEWLVPADGWRTEFDFKGDATRGFRILFANCQAEQRGSTSRFEVQPGTFLNHRTELYADRLVGFALDRLHRPEPADPSILVSPVTLKATRTAVAQPIEPLEQKNVAYADPGVKPGAPWTIAGKAAEPYAYLVKSKVREFDSKAVLLVKGRVTAGGISVGLLRDEKWAGQIDVITPGEFTAVIGPPAKGAYAIVIANNSKASDTSAVIERIGVLPGGSGQ